MASNLTLFGNTPRRWAITIPANTGNGSTILSLLRTAGYTGPDECYVRIMADQPASTTARAAFDVATPRPGAAIAATDFTTHGYRVASDIEYSEPTTGDASGSYVRSTDTNTVPALAVVLF